MGKIRPAERTQPIAFARGDAPPLWLATGDGDTVVRPRNSQNLAAAIEAAGGSASLRIYPDMGHKGIVMALAARSEEHTSELQSLMRISYAVFCLKKTKH